MHTCEHCGKEFKGQIQNANRFCSRACFNVEWKGNWLGKVGPRYSKYGLLEKTCPVCKTTFYSHDQPSRVGRDVYCSRKCVAIDKVAGHWTGKKRPNMAGANNNMWKGGLTPLKNIIRGLPENKVWTKSIFRRDNFICCDCGARGRKLHAHHIVKFSELFSEFLKLYSQFSPIEDKDTLVQLAYSYEPFWNVANGKTMCKTCHIKSHKKILAGSFV